MARISVRLWSVSFVLAGTFREQRTRSLKPTTPATSGRVTRSGVANGLDALVWIFRAYLEMGVLQPGDEVIVPANTYIASILAITENGLVPVLVEPDLQTYQIDDTRIEAAITPRTRAILIVHLYGSALTRTESANCAGNTG